MNNNRLEFPELPKTRGLRKNLQKIPNVWVPWKEDTEEDKRLACSVDSKIEKFELELFIKTKGKPNMKEISDINRKYFDNFDVFK